MTLKVESIGLSLDIEDELLDTLLEVGKRHYPKEFGGFLIGYYSVDKKLLKITDSILPSEYKSSKYYFNRSTKGVSQKFLEFNKEYPQKFYIGEWHTHPDNKPIPSTTDIKAMHTIVNLPDSCIKNPILLIIGYSKTQVEFGFYVLFNEKMYRYEM